jgi:hypothetical protein
LSGAAAAEELLMGPNSIWKWLAHYGESVSLLALLIDLLAADVLPVLAEVARDAGENGGVTRIACMLLGVLSSSAQVVIAVTSITSATSITVSLSELNLH